MTLENFLKPEQKFCFGPGQISNETHGLTGPRSGTVVTWIMRSVPSRAMYLIIFLGRNMSISARAKINMKLLRKEDGIKNGLILNVIIIIIYNNFVISDYFFSFKKIL